MMKPPIVREGTARDAHLEVSHAHGRLVSIGFKKKILARLEGVIRVRRMGQYVVEGSDR
jgi:hypothetical protein